MKLLDFTLPPSARTIFVSRPVKEKYEPMIAKASTAFYDLEVATVKHGLRACTTRHIHPDNLEAVQKAFEEQGLIFLPFKKVGSYAGFAHYHPPVIEGEEWGWYGAVARNKEDAERFAYYSTEELNHVELGRLLGYPECCLKFFKEVWLSGYIDPVWQQAERTESNVRAKHEHIIVMNQDSPYESNAMMRYIGIRAVPHIACSFDCKHTEKMGKDWIALGERLGMEGMEELKYFLQMPVEWDASKGIAYVTTPIFKIETNSVPCYPKYVVRKEGTIFPPETPNGRKFPFTESWKFKEAKNPFSGGCSK
jgi:hypothetical protein